MRVDTFQERPPCSTSFMRLCLLPQRKLVQLVPCGAADEDQPFQKPEDATVALTEFFLRPP